MQTFFGRLLGLWLIFVAIVILVSQWMGLAWRHSLVILLVSLVLTALFYKKIPLAFSIPKRIGFLFVLFLFFL